MNEVVTITPIRVQIRAPQNEELKKVIRFFWFAAGSVKENEPQYLLPMDHSDLIACLKGDMEYVSNGKGTIPTGPVFHGLRKGPVEIRQKGYCETLGISFEPWGLHPFVDGDMALYTNKIVALSEVNCNLNAEIEEAIQNTQSDNAEHVFEVLVLALEQILLEHLEYTNTYGNALSILREFCSGVYKTIEEFCDLNNMSRRKLQRYFEKYVGVSPKEFMRIDQFENSSRDLIGNNNLDIGDLVYDGHYFDQSHFTKSFKGLSSFTPVEFKKEQPAIKSKMKFGD